MADEVKDNHLEYISENYPTTLLRAVYVRNYTRIKEVLRPFKITPSQWRVLANLNEYDGQNVNSLAERSYTDRTNLSRSVAVMESEGLVVRRRENKDQRNILVFLTEKGHTKFTDVLPSVLEDIDFVLEGLSDNEIEIFMKLLRKVKNNSFRIWRPNN
ncbi:MAG: winged helix-turn-helix transcriptional regulator [Rhodospirillaceae bacterium]|nr:winged helix-turn-helix transcriptional regulator [Rhodospirillaceae bacterium]